MLHKLHQYTTDSVLGVGLHTFLTFMIYQCTVFQIMSYTTAFNISSKQKHIIFLTPRR